MKLLDYLLQLSLRSKPKITIIIIFKNIVIIFVHINSKFILFPRLIEIKTQTIATRFNTRFVFIVRTRNNTQGHPRRFFRELFVETCENNILAEMALLADGLKKKIQR